ncbi:MAG: hypothetical protein R2780_03285 [Crocinitomicaceae bacterium]|nr:hypothetical protein [Crocinitomicaceae bacterium]
MRKLFLIAFFQIFFISSSLAQIGLEVNHYRPTGDMGDIMKPTASFEIFYAKDFDGLFRWRAGINAVFLKTRLDTIPTYGVMYDGGVTVLPGWEVYRAYRNFTVALGGDLRFFEHDKINPYIGADLSFGYIRYILDFFTANLAMGSDMGNLLHYGVRPRIGLEYHLTDKVVLFTQVSRNFYTVRGVGPQGYNSYGLGTRLNLW